MAVEGAGLKGSMCEIVFHECIGVSSHEKDVLLSGYVKAWFNKMSDFQYRHHRRMHGKADK